MSEIRVDGLHKVFGPNPEDATRRLRDGSTTPEDLRSEGTTAAVVDANFEVRQGETFVVMGLSGSGKSTLIRMLNGLLRPTSGHVYVDGHDITAMSGKELRSVRQRSISMVFQHFALLPHRTVLDNAAYALQEQEMPKGERLERAREALSLVGLEGWEQQYPHQLSGGMRQRVGLARALAAGTDVLLMDEAFSALDPLIKREMQDQLAQLQAKLGKTIVFITHDLNEAMRLGDRIAVMRSGQIAQIGTAEDIINRPATDYVARFVQDVDRARVLTASSAMRNDVPPAANAVSVHPDTPLAELFEPLSQSQAGLAVVAHDQRALGTVTMASVLAVLGGQVATAEQVDSDPAEADPDQEVTTGVV